MSKVKVEWTEPRVYRAAGIRLEPGENHLDESEAQKLKGVPGAVYQMERGTLVVHEAKADKPKSSKPKQSKKSKKKDAPQSDVRHEEEPVVSSEYRED